MQCFCEFKINEKLIYNTDLWVEKTTSCNYNSEIYFNNNSLSFYSDSSSAQNVDSTINKIKDMLDKYPQIKLNITLNTNVDEYKGKKLALSRIEKVKKLFLLNGIEANRIIIESGRNLIMECSEKDIMNCLSCITFSTQQ